MKPIMNPDGLSLKDAVVIRAWMSHFSPQVDLSLTCFMCLVGRAGGEG